MGVRIYTLARELGIEAQGLIDRLAVMGIKVKSHSSSIEEDVAAKLREEVRPSSKKEVKRKAAPAAGAKPPAKPKAKKAARAAESAPRKAKPPATPPVATAPAAAAKKAVHPEKAPPPPPVAGGAPCPVAEKITVALPVNVRKMGEIFHIKSEDLIRTLMKFGVMATINQNLDAETVEIIAHEYGREVELVREPDAAAAAAAEEERDRAPRAPVVTFMGHIDHGKTSLLDAIRETKVVSQEAGGITQHIGAYEVELEKGRITFLDTPGHETFTAMRARGANVTDIAVLVVAADDGVMPQTREAIDHARAAKVPIVVAINKIDKPGASPEKVRRQLMELELAPEEYGGQTICCDVSAITKQGLDHLLEMIILQAEMMELKASPTAPARGVIIEAKMDKERGAVATALVRKGTLRMGDPIVCGVCSGKIKALFNYRGERVREGGPAKPVEVLGLNGVPQPGEELRVVESEREAKRMAESLRMERGASGVRETAKMTLEELYSKIAAGKVKELDLILKGDVQGSVEALRDALKTMGNEKVSVNIIRCAVGDVNENDIMLASASDAVAIGFHTRIDLGAKELSRKENVEIKLYDVIYKVIEDVRKALEGLLEPAIKETIVGRAEVKQLFRAAKGEPVAGSVVIEGKVVENARARVIRGDKIVQEGEISSIRRFKDPVKEAKSGMECGIRLANLTDIQEGDIIEVFKMEKIPQKL
ncbi:MAG: translation initiation factor IF-2 [Candidatus Aureabacteria bacterium]|nr:translation initiation factor IF-2 [Candidatus Auribacterota bacterium]